MNRKRHIREALERLCARAEEDAFLIVTLAGSDYFLQFAGGLGRPLLFDLPYQALDPAQTERARILFSDYEMEEGQFAFNCRLGDDLEAGADLAWRVFTEVYGADPHAELEFEES